MSGYTAPVRDMLFTLREVAGLERLAALEGGDLAAADTVAQILDEAGKLAGEVLAPINASGDREGCRLENGARRCIAVHSCAANKSLANPRPSAVWESSMTRSPSTWSPRAATLVATSTGEPPPANSASVR